MNLVGFYLILVLTGTVYCMEITCNIHDNTDTNFQRFASYMRDSRRGHNLRVRTVDQLCWPPLGSDDMIPVYVQKQEIPSGSFLIAVLGARSSAVSVWQAPTETYKVPCDDVVLLMSSTDGYDWLRFSIKIIIILLYILYLDVLYIATLTSHHGRASVVIKSK